MRRWTEIEEEKLRFHMVMWEGKRADGLRKFAEDSGRTYDSCRKKYSLLLEEDKEILKGGMPEVMPEGKLEARDLQIGKPKKSLLRRLLDLLKSRK